MTHVKAKLAVAAVALTLCVGYLVVAGVRSGWVYYLDVDQFMSDAQFADRHVRLCGNVDEQNVQVNSAALTAAFTIKGKSHQVNVRYKGIIPDNFKAGIEVVVEGQLAKDGTFEATVLMTKCASKYDAEHKDRIAENKP